MDATTDQLVQYAAGPGASALADEVVHECKRRLIDSVGCAIADYDAPLSQMARGMARRYAGTPAARVWGCSWETVVELAAFANGVMLRYLDLSDQYRVKSGGHPSDVIAPVLAAGEALHSSGASVINAMAVAYEIYCSFCEAVAIKSKGWDQPVFSVIASVIGVAKLLGLDRPQMGHAIALALTPNMALAQTRRGELSSWKGCAAANASRNAVFAVYLARDGFTGPGAVFEGKGGLWDIVGRFDWPLDVNAGAPRRIMKTHIKSFPVCFHGQSAVWAALDLRKRLQARPISAIEVETYAVSVEEMANDPTRWAPKTHESADHSLPYVVATALLDGEVTPQSFADERLGATDIADLMQRTRISADQEYSAGYPEYAACRLKVRLVTGEILVSEVKYPKGHARNPLSDQDVDTKFRSLVRGHADGDHCHKMLYALWNFDQVQDVREVLKTLVPPAER